MDPTATRLSRLLSLLAALLTPNGESGALGEHDAIPRVYGQADFHSDDVLMERFVELAAKAFSGFRQEPTREVQRDHLAGALDVLSRISLLDQQVVRAVGDRIGEQALSMAVGPVKTRIYRSLESITDEGQLRRLLLRLLQANHPVYAQILHGPVEYGRDVVALVERRGERILHMYQVKVGVLGLNEWNEARVQMENMFLVPTAVLSVPDDPPPRREGFLVINGHPGAFAHPTVDAWLKDMQDRGRPVSLMHLDALVRWIDDENLVGECRAALKELGLPWL